MKLSVQARTVTGRDVKYLRKESLVPAVIYGKHLDQAISISVDKVQLVKTFKATGRSTPVELKGEGMDYLVLFHDIQFDPVTDHVLHVDFLAVNKDELVEAEVPVTLVGSSPFEKNNLGRVQLIRPRILVEALPLNLPHDIQIDVSGLELPGEVIFLRDLDVGESVEIVEDLDLPVLTTVEFKEEEEEEPVLPEGEELPDGELPEGEEAESTGEGDWGASWDGDED